MSDHARIVVAAVGFDLGETLYHHRHPPMRWMERGRPAIERVLDSLGVDRSKARVAAGRKSPGRYSTYLRERVRRVAANRVVTDVSAAFFERFRTSLDYAPSGALPGPTGARSTGAVADQDVINFVEDFDIGLH